MSRKTIMVIFGILEAVLLFMQQIFGLEIDVTVIIAAMSNIMLYVLFRAKHDLNKLRIQSGRFKDKKFWITFISAVLIPLMDQLGINIPFLSPEAIIGILTAIMTALFGKDHIKNKET